MDTNLNCRICRKEFSETKTLHHHLRYEEKIKLGAYYSHYYSRYDRYSGVPILFKNVDQYLQDSFINHSNMVLFLKKSDISTAEEMVKQLLGVRQIDKALLYSPSQIEAKMCEFIPSPRLCYELYLNYNKICEDLGLKTRFVYGKQPTFSSGNDFQIIIDSREQNPLKFNVFTVSSGLNVGDYCATGEYYRNIGFERKSLPDLISTISQGYERFIKEIERAKELGIYLVVLCESELKFLLEKQDWIHSQAAPEFITHRIKELMQKYDNVQFLFVDGRVKMANMIEKLVSCNQDIKSLDLQYLYEMEWI